MADAASAVTYTVNPTDNLASTITASSAGDLIIINAGTYSLGSNFILPSGITLRGNGNAIISSSNLNAKYKYGIIIENLTFTSNGNHILLDGAYNVVIRKSTFLHTSDSKATNIQLATGSHDITIDGNKFDGGAWNAINLQGRSSAPSYNIVIKNNMFLNNLVHGSVDLFGVVRDIYILNNYVDGSTGLAYSHNDYKEGIPQRITLRGNVVVNALQGIYMDAGFYDSLVEGNYISNSDVYKRALYIDNNHLNTWFSKNNRYIDNKICGHITLLDASPYLSGNNFNSPKGPVMINCGPVPSLPPDVPIPTFAPPPTPAPIPAACLVFEKWKTVCVLISQFCITNNFPATLCSEQKMQCEKKVDELIQKCKKIF